MIDSSDHVSPKTGLSPTVTIRKPGGSFATPAGAVTEIANGWYEVAGNATDTNTLGPLLLHATGSGADPSDECYSVEDNDPDAAQAFPANFADLAITATAGGVTLADGVAHGGTPGSSTATLALAALNVTNGAGGNAVTFQGGSADGYGMYVSGGGTFGDGIFVTGYNGIEVAGANGGLTLFGNDGVGLSVRSSHYDAVVFSAGTSTTDPPGVTRGLAISSPGGHAVELTTTSVGSHDLALTGSGDIWDGINDRPVSVRVAATGLDGVIAYTDVGSSRTLSVPKAIGSLIFAHGNTSGFGAAGSASTTGPAVAAVGGTPGWSETLDSLGNRTSTTFVPPA